MKKLFAALLLFAAFHAKANVTLPKIFSSNMVLQRDKQLKIWGWAKAGETIILTFNAQTKKARTAADGSWQVILPAMSFGGPYTMTIAGSNTITLNNILIGDVWVCSGQSNMEWTVKNTNNAAKELEAAQHPNIRLFTVKKATAFKAQKDLEGGEWLECNAASLADFSAVGYFFGRKLNQDLNVPIGLVNSSWGGTNIQTWTSWDVMGQDAQYKNANLDEKEKNKNEVKQKQEQFRTTLANDASEANGWYAAGLNTQDWKTMNLPTLWEQTEVGNADGIIWFRKNFDLPQSAIGKTATLHLGPIDDDDVTYLNGTKIGGIKGYNIDRVYTVDASLLKKENNVLAVKVTDGAGGGGIYGAADQLYIECGGTRFPLSGAWQYKPSTVSTQFGISDDGPNSFPSQLYNAMIAPFINYAIKGAIWYQGEANTGEALKYQTMFPNMIRDWRSKWGYEFPFLWVQLANFMKPVDMPAESNWAQLREAQHKTLGLPQTGEAVIIDIGEANDIHPRNKQDVGWRLALAAEKTAYGKELVYSGPQYTSFTREANKLIVSFNNIGGGLQAKDKYGYLKGFAIAGADRRFVWAKAFVQGDKVVVYNDAIDNPIALRYAWADNPDDANLYNKEGLPASPFRTDDWTNASVAAKPNIGLQLFTLRNEFKNDVPGMFATLKNWGIAAVEGGDTYKMPLADYKNLLSKYGLKMVSVGSDFGELETNPQKAIDLARAYGANFVVCFWIPHQGDTFTIAETKKAVDVFNKAGSIIKAAGLTLCYHPHGYEFRPYQNGTLFDYLAKNTEGNLQFEMDVFWVKQGGADPLALLKQYPDRFKLMHLKDRRKGTVGNQNGRADEESNVILGTGDVGIAAIMQAAKQLGIQYYFIEDESPRPLEQVPQSLVFLRGLE